MANQFTTKEVLNKVLLDSSGDAITANSVTSQEALNAVLDTSNNRLNVSLGGSNTISGDVTITGDLTVQGSATNTFDEQIQGIVQILGSTGTGATPAGTLQLTTSETTIVDNDQLGRIEFLAASEADGSDSQLVGASIAGEAEATFAADNNSTALVFSTNTSAAATERMRITSTGAVSIGPSVPTAGTLVVSHATDSSIVIQSAVDGGSDASLFFKVASGTSNTNKKAGIVFRDIGTNGIGDLYFLNDSTADGNNATVADNTAMVIKSGGNVGIGTASPVAKMDIVGTRTLNLTDNITDDNNKNAVITHSQYDSGTQTQGFMLMQGFSNSSTNRIDIGGGNSQHNATEEIKFHTAANATTATGTERMAINNSGDLQLQERLTFSGTNNTTAIATMNLHTNGFLYVTGGTGGLALSAEGGSDVIKITDGGGTGAISFEVGNTQRFKLDANSRISLSNNDSGTSNTIFGKNTAISLDAGSNYNTFIGENVADASLDDATYNVGIGYNALTDLTTADSTVAIGGLCLENITTGTENTAVGTSAMRNSTTANNNTAIGRQAMGSGITTGTDNTAIGINSGLAITSSQFNTLIGSNSGSSITTGWNSVMIGYATGDATVDSHKHTLVGAGACGNGDLTTDGAVAVGYTALADLTVGTCVGVGFEAGKANAGGGNNTFLGYKSGHTGTVDIVGGHSNTFVGAETRGSNASAINQTVIGKGAEGKANNAVILGNADVTAVYMAHDKGATVHCAGAIVTEGINFPDDASASPSSDANTLDNYEEGVFEVAVTGGTSGSWSTSSSGGYLSYVKIGKLCHISGYIEVDTDNSASGIVKITLPFTSAVGLTEASDLQWGSASVADGGTTLNAVVSGAYIPENQAYFHLYHVTDAGAFTYYSDSNLDAGWVARVGFTYRTNN